MLRVGLGFTPETSGTGHYRLPQLRWVDVMCIHSTKPSLLRADIPFVPRRSIRPKILCCGLIRGSESREPAGINRLFPLFVEERQPDRTHLGNRNALRRILVSSRVRASLVIYRQLLRILIINKDRLQGRGRLDSLLYESIWARAAKADKSPVFV